MSGKTSKRPTRSQPTPARRYPVALGGLLLLLLCWNLRNHASVLENGQRPPSLVGSDSIPPMPLSPIPTIAAGQWQIAGADWNFAVRSATDTEVDKVLRQPPGGWGAAGTTAPEDVAVLELFKLRLAKLHSSHNIDVLGSDSRTFKVRIFSRPDPPVVLGGHVAYPRGKGWTVLSVTPAINGSTSRFHRDVLPLPESVRRICTRVGDRGEAQCDVVVTSDSIGRLTQFWQDSDWQVFRPQWAQKHGNIVFCKRGGRLVQVTIQRAPAQDQTVLILVSGDIAATRAS